MGSWRLRYTFQGLTHWLSSPVRREGFNSLTHSLTRFISTSESLKDGAKKIARVYLHIFLLLCFVLDIIQIRLQAYEILDLKNAITLHFYEVFIDTVTTAESKHSADDNIDKVGVFSLLSW